MNNSIKVGARHSASDNDKIQAIHDHASALGADCATNKTKSLSSRAMKDLLLNPQAYAVGESWDIQQAANALAQLAGLAGGEIDEQEPDNVSQIVNAMRELHAFIGDEIDEMEQAASQMQTGTSNSAMMSGYKGQYSTEQRKQMAKDGKAKPDGSYPIANKQDVHDAVLSWGRGGATQSDKEWIIKRAKAVGATDELPADWPGSTKKEDGGKSFSSKVLSLAYIKSLHLPISEQQFKDQFAVKFIGHDEVTGYLALWGNPQLVDVEKDYFEPRTDFWDGKLGFPRPLTWDHGQDRNFKSHPVVGQILELGDDEWGRWYHSALSRKEQYFNYLSKMIGARDLGTSSDSAPQYVVREKSIAGKMWTKNGIGDWECDGEFKSELYGAPTFLKMWALFGGALTTTPAEPRMFGTVDYWKSIGVTLLTAAGTSHEATSGIPAELRREGELLRIRFQEK